MIKKENYRLDAADLLSKVLNRVITPKDAMGKWPDASDKDMDVALHLLQHFENDNDIRKKDAKYATWQSKEIENMIIKLRAIRGFESLESPSLSIQHQCRL